jgi:hypothetical protein
MSRNHERFRPKPRPENAITLSKKSVAKSQLETAVSLWFQNGDPASILVLAYNAHEILDALGRKIGKPSQLKTWLATLPERVQMQWKYVWNFCKHGLKDIDDDVPYDPRQAEVLISNAIRCYRDVFGKLTPILLAFDFRFVLDHPETVDWFAAAQGSAIPFSELIEAYRQAGSQTREEFLQSFLLLSEAGLVPLTYFHSAKTSE